MVTRQTTMEITEALGHFDEVLRRIDNDEAVTIERDGQPKAVVISVEEYRRRIEEDPPAETQEATDEKPEWLKKVEEAGKLLERDLQGKKIDWDQIIYDMREDRSRQLLENLGITTRSEDDESGDTDRE